MDLKAINSTDSEIKAALENERSFFEKLETEFKNLLFGVIFALLKDDEANIWVTGVLAIIEFFQILIFPFHIQVNFFYLSIIRLFSKDQCRLGFWRYYQWNRKIFRIFSAGLLFQRHDLELVPHRILHRFRCCNAHCFGCLIRLLLILEKKIRALLAAPSA